MGEDALGYFESEYNKSRFTRVGVGFLYTGCQMNNWKGGRLKLKCRVLGHPLTLAPVQKHGCAAVT